MLKDDIEKQEIQALSQKDSQDTNHKIHLIFHDLFDVLSDKNQMHSLIFFILTSLNGDKGLDPFPN